MKNLFYCITFVFVLVACSDNEDTTNFNDNDVAAGVAAGFSTLKIDFTHPVTYSYSNEAEKEEIISKISGEIFEVELTNGVTKDGDEFYEEFAANIVINSGNRTIVITPKPVQQIIGQIQATGDDNEDCGGKAGDGWKSYGTCMSKPCIEDKSKAAAANLEKKLTSGKCLDIRVKRNTLNARVCARVISC